MIHFFRLVRPLNLVVIALTMYGLHFFYTDLLHLRFAHYSSKLSEQIDFFLLVFSMLLIAAGGNIINDYFDVRADRVNRPERLIISKYIKRRWAIISHWLLNGLAFSIAVYLSVRHQTFWYVFVHLISINALWFYSMLFKRKVVIGNLVVAILTALVPVLCGIHLYLTAHGIDHSIPMFGRSAYFADWMIFMAEDGKIIFAMAIFAFLLNFAREIIKDIQDVSGDQLIYAKTLPMKIGVKGASRIAAITLLLMPIATLTLYFYAHTFSIYDLHLFLPLVFALVLSVLVAALLWKKRDLHVYKLLDRTLKVAMLFGVLIPFYWYWF